MQFRPIGVLTALPQELEILLENLQDGSSETVGGFSFHVGEIDGQQVVLSQSAAGKVNGAALATMMAYAFDCRALVFSGVAGGLNPAKNVGDIIVADKMVQHDYGAMIDGSIKVYHPGDHCIGDRTMDVPIEMRPDVLAKLKTELNDVSFGTILTGDQFLNCETTRKRLFDEFQADAIEMEGGAVAQIAVRFKIPWVVIRCLSDLAGDESHIDFGSFLKQASDRAATTTLKALKAFG